MRPTPITMQPPGTAVLSAAASATGSAAPSRSTINRSRSRGHSLIANAESIVPSRTLALPSVTLNRSADTRDSVAVSDTNAMALIDGLSSPATDTERWTLAEADITGASVRRARRTRRTTAAAGSGRNRRVADDAGGIECRDLAFAIARDRCGGDRAVGRTAWSANCGVARPRQHLAHVVGVGTAKARHRRLVGVADGGRAVVRAVVTAEDVLR